MTAEHAHALDAGGEVEAVHPLAAPIGKWIAAALLTRYWNVPALIAKVEPITRQTAADAVLAEARRLCCGENPSAHHAATDKHSELMAFAGRLAGAVRGL
jgi:hypothetical protein